MSAITFRMDMTGRFGPARDQGTRPTCLVFAMSDAHAAARGAWNDLSCEYLFYHAKLREKAPPSSGARLSFTRQALEHDGQPLESAWQYLTALPADLTQWVPPVPIGALFRRSSTLVPGTFDAAWAAVEAATPVLILMTISDAFYTPDDDGIVNVVEALDSARHHAVVGIASGERTGVRHILVRNSWGDGWGLAGNAWLAEPYLKPRISQLYVMD